MAETTVQFVNESVIQHLVVECFQDFSFHCWESEQFIVKIIRGTLFSQIFETVSCGWRTLRNGLQSLISLNIKNIRLTIKICKQCIDSQNGFRKYSWQISSNTHIRLCPAGADGSISSPHIFSAAVDIQSLQMYLTRTILEITKHFQYFPPKLTKHKSKPEHVSPIEAVLLRI